MEDYQSWGPEFISCIYSKKLLSKLSDINEKARNKVDLGLIKKAIYFGKKYHEGQMRQSGEPYISHPLAVAGMVADYLFDTNAIVAAILHDTIEDTNLTYQMILEEFNLVVATNVYDLTRFVLEDGNKVSCSQMITNWLIAGKKDVMVIKLFDRVHNIETIKAKSPAKIQKIVDETLDYFILLSEHLNLLNVSQYLHAMCVNITATTKMNDSDDLAFNFSFKNYDQPLSLIYQSDIYLKRTLL